MQMQNVERGGETRSAACESQDVDLTTLVRNSASLNPEP
jgi:hypothetical protein